MIHIAVVEDNEDLRDEVVFHLSRMGHRVTGLPDGAALDRHLAAVSIDVLVLDLGLPGEDGVSIARRLGVSHPRLAIAMLTARGQLEDRLAGLESGADIYLVKPVDMRELSAVCDSLYRRLNRADVPERPAEGWQLDVQSLELVPPGGAAILLTPTEFKLMRVLAEAAPEPAHRRDLAAAMGHPELDFDFRRLETALSRLRRKIEARSGETTTLRSARNVGYVFAAPIRVWQG
ncbi:MAG: response regulator transcription factor [Zoogloea sp.]|jgi:DNA-binding response OmpR family regulator|uniref:response regulator transcription factor n=1 Tax=Zoogloea sp. TaxID=49181 RepID=UPI00260E47B2|nr:response regulator transcription factor [Zoogloea sp.]MDD3328158.1 response regulator transcription factor [Zoogloea sp.]